MSTDLWWTVVLLQDRAFMFRLSPHAGKFRAPGVWSDGYLVRRLHLLSFDRIIAMCGDYYIGGRRFSSLSDLIGYYSYVSCLLKGEKLQSPVAPPEVSLASQHNMSWPSETQWPLVVIDLDLDVDARNRKCVDHSHSSSACRRPKESEGHPSIHQSAGYWWDQASIYICDYTLIMNWLMEAAFCQIRSGVNINESIYIYIYKK